MINIILNILFIIVYFKVSTYLNTFLQQNHYKLTPLKYLKLYYTNIYFLIWLIISSLSIFNITILNVLIIFITIIYIFYEYHFIIKLKISKRMIRIYIISTILSGLLYLPFKSILLPILCYPFIQIITLIILMPLEKLIIKYYKVRSLHHLKKINPYIIEITGSYGKTSLKHLIAEIYKQKYLTTSSIKSYNTISGVCKTIQSLHPLSKILICEAGATKPNDIKEITKLLNPDLGVITGITYQHMSSFKTISTILKTKYEIVKYSKDGCKFVINTNDEFLKDLTINHHYVTYVGSSNSEYYPKNIKLNPHLSFDIYHYDQYMIHIESSLCNYHDAYNLTLAYGVIKTNNTYPITDEEFKTFVQNIKPMSNRLEAKIRYENTLKVNILDDSYNANLNGFKSALNTLKTYPHPQAIITPGIVDIKGYEDLIYEAISPLFKDLDDVILIKHPSLKYLCNYLDSLNIYYTKVSSFNEAYKYLINKYAKYYQISLLIENDLPDIYLKGE